MSLPTPAVTRIRCRVCGAGLADRDGALEYIRHRGRDLVVAAVLMRCGRCGSVWESDTAEPAKLAEARPILERGFARAAAAATRAREHRG